MAALPRLAPSRMTLEEFLELLRWQKDTNPENLGADTVLRFSCRLAALFEGTHLDQAVSST